ncbi:1-phosphatidylinositol-3-phosphate 5-kinase [Rhizopus azygosporus]|uniref:1-phosphatidylinositol-3-phosphate 5-kinase n=1 Tax=Rhizopus azygosporus TaxID=86630 RepID=A0A367KH55_RHIAZ|nr:1-phosphatidylinositol-3-phosphate 5-kinase [Rhizopus azygosporus]
MEKAHQPDYEDPGSLTSFNIIAEGDEEGLISKIFSKFKTAVSGPQHQQPVPIPTEILESIEQENSLIIASKERYPTIRTINPTPTKEVNLSIKSLHESSSTTIKPEGSSMMIIPLTKTSSCDSDTQSVMTNFSVSNTNSLSRMLNRLRGGEADSGNKDFWMPDEQCRECTDCNAPFNLFRRKHHCRTCGRIFCSKCLNNTIHTSHTLLRVCNDCYIKFEDRLPDDLISIHETHSGDSETLQQSVQDSDEEFERRTNSLEIQRPNLDLHFSLSTSSHHTTSDAEIGIKKLLTSTFLRTTPRSRTSTMNSLAVESSLAVLESRQLASSSPMPFRRHSYLANENPLGTPVLQNEYYEEDEDARRWDKSPRNLLNFLGGAAASSNNTGTNERPSSGIFNNIFFEDYATTFDIGSPTPLLSTSTTTTTTGKTQPWLMRPERAMRRRLSLTDGTGNGSNNNVITISTNNSSSTIRHSRVRTKSLMRNIPITKATMEASTSSQLDTSNITCTDTNSPRSATPDVEQLRTQIASCTQTHQQWDESFLHLMRNMIRHFLEVETEGLIKNPGPWEEIMMKLLLKIADEVQPQIRIRDTFDMNHYVKIKRVPGGTPKDSFSVSGVVLSKNVAHKHMVRKIENPRILILNFDLDGFSGEVNRHEYLKLDRLLAWERDHMNALVDQIIGLKPSIVLIASHAPRTVIDLLNKANIVVVYKVKRQKLDAIARCADAAIFNYKNDLWNTRSVTQGKCKLFETMTIMHEYLPSRRKTFLLFHECPKDRGATIILRGGEHKVLTVIKTIMKFMVQVVNNLTIEAQLRKEFIELRKCTAAADVVTTKKKGQFYQQEPIIVEDDDICLTAINTVLNQYQNTVLSISPGVTLPVPHILMKLRDSQKKLIGVIRERLGPTITGTVFEGDIPEQQQDSSKFVPPPIPRDLNQMMDYFKAYEAQLENDVEYRHYQDLHIQNWYNFKKYIRDVSSFLSPVDHQEILVHRTIYPMDDHTIPCQKIVAEPYHYYDPACDYTLGQYILNAAKEAYKPCTSKICGSPLMFHDVTFSHGNAQIKVQVFHEVDDEQMVEERLEIGKDEYLKKIPIFISTHCNLCKITHGWKPMSELLQRYSFGKFLELLLYQSSSIPLYEDGEQEDEGCPHGLYRDHTLSFRIQNYTVNFTHAMVKVVEVIPPPLHTCFSSKKQMALKDEALESTRIKIARFFDSIIERNKAFSYDIVQPNMVETCKEYLQEMSQEAMKNKKSLLQKLQSEYATSSPTDTLQLNNVLAELQNHAVTWDLKYIDFARRFIRPERELRRLTTSHLRRMFPAESLLYSSTPTPVVSNLNLRTKRAVEAADLPLLDVTLEEQEDTEHPETELKDQPSLGESPTQSFPWLDEVQQFDQKFLQDAADVNTSSSAFLGSSAENSRSVPLSRSATEETLDPSVARRLSLELMKDTPSKAGLLATALSSSVDKQQRQKFLEKSMIYEDAHTPSPQPTPTVMIQDEAILYTPSERQDIQSAFARHVAPTAYQRLTGLLPEPTVCRSKSSPSSGVTPRHKRTLSHHKALETTDKVANRRSFYETSTSYMTSSGPALASHTDQAAKPYRGYYASRKSQGIPATRYGYRFGFIPPDDKHHSRMTQETTRPYSRTVTEQGSSSKLPIRGRIPVATPLLHQKSPSRVTYHQPSHLPIPISRRKLANGRDLRERLPSKASLEVYTKIKEIAHDDDSLSSSDEGKFGRLPFQHTTFSLVHMDEYDECLGRDTVPSILELQQFNKEHQLQMSNNTLPFLSVETGLYAGDKKDNQSKTAVLLDLDHGVTPTDLDWSTNGSGKNSIMKAITYVLAEKSISNLLPLEYPFSPTEHIFADSNILVREDEPSSIISYMLASTFYREKLEKRQALRMSKVVNNRQESASISSVVSDAPTDDKLFYSDMFPETGEAERPWRFSFKGGSTSFTCKIYYAEQFDMFRKMCGCGETFISSLARCNVWNTAGGKSGSTFLKTKDERFLIKQISKFEMDAFVGSANKYFMYMFNEVFDKGIPTVLCKIFGLYRIGFYNNVSGKSMKMDILVMENLFYEHTVKMAYDLKGSLRNRYAAKTGKDIEVFLDENLVEMISKTPLYMRVDTKNNLSDSLYNDTQFLVQIDVMDYSLLVGFDDEKNEIVVGIVDFFRTYTWDKKLESWVKESGMLGGVKRDPTIISPKMYRRRFRSAIDLYFVMIPDFWTLLHN